METNISEVKTRRKQAKPQRKQVDPDGNPVEDTTILSSASKKIASQMSPDSNHNNHPSSNTKKLNGFILNNKDLIIKISNDTSTTIKNTSKENNDDTELNEISNEDLTNGSCYEGKLTIVEEDYEDGNQAEKKVEKKKEDEEIQEYLRRSDTAVIFPEPVGHNNVPSLTSSNSSKDAPETDFIKCPQCGVGQPTFQSLREHLEQVHGGSEEPTSLGATGTSPPPGVTPVPKQNGPYACSQCPSSFNTKEQLEKHEHEKLHSSNAQVSCKTCHKTFANVYRLQRHMISHDESAILRKFKCTECEKAFKFKHHLKEHIRIHSGEKPFECGNCGKRFSHSGSYSSHMTSKKCLVMNLKMGRNRTSSNTLLEKTQVSSNRGPKRQQIINSSLNNNITSSPNQNSPYLPILPKYEAAAALLSVMAPRDGSYPPTSLSSTTYPYFYPPGLHLGASGPQISPYTMSASLGQFLEQLQQNHNQSQSRISPPEVKSEVKQEQEDRKEIKEEEMDENRNSSRCSNDLVMDTDEPEPESNPQEDRNSINSNSNDFDAVKKILDTVNATVTKQLLQVNMQKLSAESPRSEECRSVSSTASNENNTTCGSCKKVFGSLRELENHDCLEQSEGLAAKLEQAAKSIKLEESYEMAEENEEMKSNKDDFEIDSESVTTTDHVNEDGRKVRVRSLIADEQLAILKEHYASNPRPKREELSRIAEKIGFPVRVVQVWFQNTRARDRREGRLVQIPYSLQVYPQNIVPSQNLLRTLPFGPSSPHDQPLDLSVKKESSIISSPGSSPHRPTSIPHSDSEEAVNLSQKSSRSPTPFHSMPYQTFPSSNSSDFNRSPSPATPDISSGSRLARILAQPNHRLASMGLVPMERLLQFQEMNSRSPLLNNSSSPGSEKRSWKEDLLLEDLSNVSENFDEEIAKRAKLSNQLTLKGINNSLLGNSASPETEIEGQFICDQCEKAFSKQSSLARHKYEHSGQRPHKCDECTKAFKHKHHLTEHKRLHSGEKPFQCSKCLKRFSHSGSYSQHMNHRYSYCKPYRE